MEYDDDDDTHFCIKCHLTINGLDNYVQHRQIGCRTDDDKSGTVHDPPSTPTTVSYPEILNADAFFSSLELQSSAKSNTRRMSTLLLDRSRKSGKPEDRRKKPRKDKSPDDQAAKEKLSNLMPVVADVDDPTDHLFIPSLVGFPDILPSSTKPTSTVTSSKSTQSVGLPAIKSDPPLDRKQLEEPQIRQDHREPWLGDPVLNDVVDNKNLSHTSLNRFEFDYQQEEESDDSSLNESEDDDSYSDSDEDRDMYPREHTGGKWKPGLATVTEIAQDQDDEDTEEEQPQEHPPSSYTGGKWKPADSSVQKHDEFESKGTGVPPPGHTRGKWVPGAGSDVGGSYWCSPCGRKLASRLVYNRHLMSDLHARRSVQEIDGDLHLARTNVSLLNKKSSKRLKTINPKPKGTADLDEDETKKRTRRREKAIVACEICLARVRRTQMGKHLLSHYHCRVAGVSPGDAKARHFLLNNMVNVVRQCPFQCATCRFYCNTEETFLMHWRSSLHCSTNEKMSGSYKCTACNFRCEDNDAMETHLLSRGHRDVVSVMNGSVPVVIRRQRILSCCTCGAHFRYNLQLRLHQDETKHNVDETASDEYQKRMSCSLCGKVFRNYISLQRHQLASHVKNSENTEGNEPSPYFCSFCDETFKTSKEAVMHRRTANHKAVVKMQKSDCNQVATKRECKHCADQFTDLNEFRQHCLEKHLEFCYRCLRCGVPFAISQDLTHHTRENKCKNSDTEPAAVNDNENHWRCKKCAFASDSQAEFLLHESFHGGPVETETNENSKRPKFKCNICEKILYKNTMRSHMRSHTGERPFACTKCSASFIRLPELKKHTQSCGKSCLQEKIKDDKTRKYACQVCTATFRTRPILRQHMFCHDGKKYKCGLPGCPTKLRTKTELQQHRILVHEDVTPDKKFKCNDCSYTAKTKNQLTRHCYRHKARAEEDCIQLVCQYTGCNFRTKRSAHLKRHMRLHTGIKAYKCRHCNYASNNLENLRKHVLSTTLHAGKTMYECEQCVANNLEPFCTNFVKELRAHLIDAHPAEFRAPDQVSEYLLRLFDPSYETSAS